jgi:hypothetical protein
MVVMEVRNQSVVDPANSSEFRCGDNTIGVSPTVIRPARVNQQRLFCGRDEQGRLSSFDIHKKDMQWLASVACCHRARKAKKRDSQNQKCGSSRD